MRVSVAPSKHIGVENTLLTKLRNDPYRVFFPLGVIFALLGSGLWPMAVWLTPDLYPGPLHRDFMIQGFVLSFATGFLMTAIPRFTSTERAKTWEFFLPLLLLTTLLWPRPVEEGLALPGTLTALAVLIFLFFYAGKRVLRRGQNPPSTFVFIGLGLVLATVGLITRAVFGEDFLGEAGLRIVIYHFPLALILGVGGRLVPGILGYTEIVMEQRSFYERPVPLIKSITPSSFALVATMLASAALYFLGKPWASNFMLFLSTMGIALLHWKPWRLPKDRHGVSWGLWASCWMILFGLGGMVFLPDYDIHLAHLYFVGGAALMIFMIGSRVSFAHQDALADQKRPFLKWIIGLVILAGVTRAIATFFPDSYFRHLGYAGILLMIAFLWWAIKLTPFWIPKKD